MCDQNGRLLSYDYPLAEKLKEIVSIYWLPNNLKIHQYAWAHHALELPHTGPTTDHACTNTNIQSQMFETINLLYLSVYITNYEINKMPTRLWIQNDLYTSTKFFNR